MLIIYFSYQTHSFVVLEVDNQVQVVQGDVQMKYELLLSFQQQFDDSIWQLIFCSKKQSNKFKHTLSEKCFFEKYGYYQNDRGYQVVSNPIQNNEIAHTRYVLESNKLWRQLEGQFKEQFLVTQGAVNFGEKDSKMKFGNIVLSNYVLEQINETQVPKIKKTFMDSITNATPEFFRNFKMDEQEEHNWSALYQPDGTVIRQYQAHKALEGFLRGKSVPIKYSSFLKEFSKVGDGYKFLIKNYTDLCNPFEEEISAKKIFLAEDDLWTAYYLKYVVEKQNKSGHLFDELTLNNHTISYCELTEEGQKYSGNLPIFSNYFKMNQDQKAEAVFGMGPQSQDSNLDMNKSIFIRSTKKKQIDKNQFIKKASKDQLYQPDVCDQGVLNNVRYAEGHLHVTGKYKHYPYLRVNCEGRQTILGHLHRNNKSFVVQTSGFFDKYALMLARNAVEMLYKPQIDVSKQYGLLSLIRYPIRDHVKYLLNENQIKINQYYSSHEEPLSFETVVVGAGCGGLYAAYRLFKDGEGDTKKVAIFEMSDRISGRLMSFRFKGGRTAVELGGMRFIPESHPLLRNVVDELQIPVIDFPMRGDPLQIYQRKAFLRNVPYSQEEWSVRQEANQRLAVNYNISESFITEEASGNRIIGMSADQMMSYSFWKIVTEIERNKASVTEYLKSVNKDFVDCFKQQSPISFKIMLNLQEWNAIKQILVFKMPFTDKNQSDIYVPLYKMGCQNVLEAQFGHQAYQFISDQNGYYSNTMNCSYNELMCAYLVDFTDVEYKTLQGGYDMMNFNIANYLLDPDLGLSAYDKYCGIYLNHELIDVTESKSGGYDLVFKTNLENNSKRVVKAKKIILAMPKRSIQLVANKVKLFSQSQINYNPNYYTNRNYYKNEFFMKKSLPLIPKDIYQLLETSVACPAIRIMMNFSQNWWDPVPVFNKDGVTIKSAKQMRGVSVTDLPIRQTLYFSTPTQNMILGSYNDMVPSQYWSPLQLNFLNDQHHSDAEARQFIVDLPEKSVNYEHRASYILERQLCRQLSLVHGKHLDIILKSLKECCYQNWQIDPYGGGYHNFRSGYDIESCMIAIRKPFKGKDKIHDIFIVGQAYSNLTGWVQGAYQTCQKVLTQHYKLRPATTHYAGY